VLLPSVSARREAFDEYCRDRARELRQNAVKQDKNTLSPKEEFEKLLREEVKSTRTTWAEFRRQWKKERRFWGWGRDDREREKKFKEYLKELGESEFNHFKTLCLFCLLTLFRPGKREAAQKAEVDFFALLKECEFVKPDSPWKDVCFPFLLEPVFE